jgi:plastocyanin
MKTNTLFRQLGVLLIAALLFAACSKSDDATAVVPGSTTVIMKGMKFLPFELRVMPGTVVNWANGDSVVYSVTADDGSFESGDINPGGSYSRTFNVPGVYNYHSRHGFEMKGIITVTSTP